ncbi:LacI family DNA-binding transcriptional regulator [Leifsonia sp. NPDC102414]|jgi:DNA-binding LacI/PurR family transcriptional regulator|uniref:LacI family DNA-binding transcriptional regulator n=1 Tax=Leifsonia sp. NPDC102414 TaxID=3364124 RepID=UPI0037FF2567
MATDPPKRRPTINDVADAAGVSRGTVSRVLNGGHWVSPDAHAAVTAAIKKTGYRINAAARSLATNRAHSIAFLLTEPHDLLFEDPNFSILMRGAADALAERDVSLVLIMAAAEDEQRRALDFIAAGSVDGVLLVSSHSGGQAFVSAINKLGLPAVACGIPLGFERRMGYVTADDEHGARTMVEYLHDKGRRVVATIAGPQDTSGGQLRLAGYRAALGDDVDESLIVEGDYGRASGAAAMRALLERRPDVDAVFAANDRMAAAAIAVIEESGRRVPEDIAVAGFDDSPAAVQSSPTITTMRQPFGRISREMVRMLLEQIDGGDFAAITVPTELVPRESA